MRLQVTIENAINLTVELEAALIAEDLDHCHDLIATRTEAMAQFELTHKNSSESDRLVCQKLLVNLKAVDDKIQSLFKDGLKSCAEDLRHAMTSGSSIPVGAYKSQVSPGCLDRKV